jgi:Sulfotransferase domain
VITVSEDNTYQIQDDDICVVAYPKSGNHFLLFLVTMLLYRKKIDWTTKREMVQSVLSKPVKNLPSPHLVWSHSSYDVTYPKVIYLVRDPRDIVISYYYHHLKYTGKRPSFDEFFERFMKGNIYPGRWDSNIESWLANQKEVKNGFLLVKYEDLLKNTSKEAHRIINFLNLDRTEKEIKEAVNWASFDNMKSLENKQEVHLNSRSVNASIPFVRKGRANGWKADLNKEQQQKINQQFYKVLTKLGYSI